MTGAWTRRHVPAPRTPAAGHRTRLRFFEVLAGRMRLDILAELVTQPQSTVVSAVAFVRDGDALRPADTPGAPDVTGALTHARMWVMLRERRSGHEAYAATEVSAEAVPYGPPRRRLFTVRFAAVADFDVLATLGRRPCTGSWDAYTILDTAGTRSTVPLGAHRDRIPVDAQLRPVEVVPGVRLDPVLTGFGSRLTFEIEDRRAAAVG